LQIDAEKAPFLVERLKVWMLPTLALVKRQKTVDYVVGFDEFGGKDDFPTEVSMQRDLIRGLCSSSTMSYVGFCTFGHALLFCFSAITSSMTEPSNQEP